MTVRRYFGARPAARRCRAIGCEVVVVDGARYCATHATRAARPPHDHSPAWIEATFAAALAQIKAERRYRLADGWTQRGASTCGSHAPDVTTEMAGPAHAKGPRRKGEAHNG